MYNDALLRKADYYYSLQNYLKEREKALKKNIEEKEKRAVEKPSHRKAVEQAIEDIEQQIRIVRACSNIISDAKQVEYFTYNPSEELKEALSELEKVATDTDIHKVYQSINKDIRERNYFGQVKEIKQKQRIIASMPKSMRKKQLTTFVENTKISRGNLTFEECLDRLIEAEKKEMDVDKGTIDIKNEEKISLKDHHDLIELARSDVLEPSSKNRAFKENVGKIIEQLEAKERAEKTIAKCKKIFEALYEEMQTGDIKYDDAIKMIKEVSKRNADQLAQATEFLSQFDMDKYEEEAKAFVESKRVEVLEDTQTNEYKNIVKQIEELRKDPNADYSKIEELQERLSNLKIQKDGRYISDEEYEVLEAEAQEELKHQEEMDKMLAKEDEREKNLLIEVNRQYIEYLKQEAIRELNSEGAFDPIYQEMNGDIRDVNPNSKNRNDLIQEKMNEIAERERSISIVSTKTDFANDIGRLREIAQEQLDYLDNVQTDDLEIIDQKVAEIVREANMTPVERGLYEDKKNGRIPEDKSVSDLTPSEIREYNINYADGRAGYEHTREIKSLVPKIAETQKQLRPEEVEEVLHPDKGRQIA